MTVTVGFAPATSPGLVTGGTTAASEEGAPEGLFAALLAMLAPTADGEPALPEAVTSADFAALVQSIAPTVPGAAAKPKAATAGELAASTDEAATGDVATLPKTPEGKGLLKNLGDALVALDDALETNQPVDPALEKKLNEALGALAVYLGTVAPPPAVAPVISALASGEGVLPAIPEIAPAAPDATSTPAATPLPGTDADQAPQQSAATIAPVVSQPTEAPDDLFELVADLAAAVTSPEPVADAPEAAVPTSPTVPAATATRLSEAPPALQQLGLYIGRLSQRLEPADPELARKLDALAQSLKSGTVPDDLAAALGLDEAGSEPELKRILDALATTRPAAAKPAEAQPFTAPSLDLPEIAAPLAKKADAAPAPNAGSEPISAPKMETSEPELASPVTASAPRAEKPEAAEARAAPTTTPAPQSASTDAASQSTASAPAQTQPAAPVARTIHAAYQVPVQQVNLPQVAFEVVRQFDAGNSRFQIRLDPPELGRIDVKLDVDKSGTISARMTVERPETLDLMQRDQRALQQALQQAGLDANKTNLEFSLRQNPFAAQGGMGDGRDGQPGFAGDTGGFGNEEAAAEVAATTYRGTATAGGVNLFV